jgi:COP9 signalosome complex subunit 6
MAEQSKSLLSSQKSSVSGLQVHLHPLVLLTVSDYVTRHVSRRRHDPIVGALLGRQIGREISLEFAFECDMIQGDEDAFKINDSWFRDRLQQYKDVHKVPPLDLVGWFTTAPLTGPEAPHVSIHQQILYDFNETAVLLAFHPVAVLKGASVGGKLPLTIYESVFESVKAEGQNSAPDEEKMEIEGQEVPQDSKLGFRFRELPYSVETGEAEMIGVDFVARGNGNAIAATTGTRASLGQATQDTSFSVGDEGKKAGKQREDETVDAVGALSPEDEERG